MIYGQYDAVLGSGIVKFACTYSGLSIEEKHACFADRIAGTSRRYRPDGTYPDAATCAERMVRRKDGRLDPLIGRVVSMVEGGVP